MTEHCGVDERGFLSASRLYDQCSDCVNGRRAMEKTPERGCSLKVAAEAHVDTRRAHKNKERDGKRGSRSEREDKEYSESHQHVGGEECANHVT